MKKTLRFVFVLCFILVIGCFAGFAQNMDRNTSSDKYTIHLRGEVIKNDGSFTAQKDLGSCLFGGKYYVLLQFEDIPSEETFSGLYRLGINIMSYIPNYTYYVSIPKKVSLSTLKTLGVRQALPLPISSKINPILTDYNSVPAYSKSAGENIYATISYPPKASLDAVQTSLRQKGFILHKVHASNHEIELFIAHDQLYNLAKLPFVSSVYPVTPPTEPLNYENTTEYGSRKVHEIKGLRGKGIIVGVGDDSRWDHLDGINRVSNHNAYMSNHGEVVAGLIAGGGNLDEIYTGHAPEAQIVTFPSYLFLDTINWLIDNYDVVLANHSYGNTGSTCPNFGFYTSKSRQTDQQLVDNQELMHVISCGNSGDFICGSYPKGFHTILDAHQSSKNGLDVANLSSSTLLTSSSSKGPLVDGRLKPEIAARGNTAISTATNNGYGLVGGTSSAAPVVTGIMALMYEQYKKQFGGENPRGGLMKAIVCNTAEDLGNPGPDFSFGFGKVNAKKAIETIENETYFVNTLVHNETKSHSIVIDPGVKRVKVMLYWNDVPSDVNAALPGLVNNLNLQVTDANNITTLPWILDPSPANVNLPATRGIDNINNIEQVTLENPIPGILMVEVLGSFVPMGNQEYYIAYELIRDEVELIHPTDGKAFVPGEEQIIHWNAEMKTDPFHLYYSTNNGASWNLISDSIPGDARNYTWLVPNIVADQVRVKVEKNGQVSISDLPFAIISTPESLEAEVGCNFDISVNWDPVSNAAGYEVLKLTSQDTFMNSVGITVDTSFSFNAGTIDSETWVSVRALTASGLEGRRTTAISVFPLDEIEEVNFNYGVNQLETQFFHISGKLYSNYYWDFGDGENSTLENPSHTYQIDGNYTVCLSVFDGICSDSTICKSIDVLNSTNCRTQDSMQLVALLNSSGPIPSSINWSANIPLDQWTGVTLTSDGCNIKELAVNGQFFLYTMPSLRLPELTKLDLSQNFMFGDLRGMVLPKCEELFLYTNQLSGQVPDFSNMSQLIRLYLNNNELAGSVPNFNLPNLYLLYLNNNNLTGELPDFSSTNLVNIYIQNNHLSGRLPDYSNTNLNILHVHNNEFTYDGLAQNLSIPNFSYSPQAKVPILEYGHNLYVEVGGTQSNVTYEWFNQNDQLLTSKVGDKMFAPPSSGIYYCKVTNSLLNLVLYSEDFNFSPRLDLNIAGWLEGPLNFGSGWPYMNTYLNSVRILPGQRSSFGTYQPPKTKAGQPYSSQNSFGYWGYEGTEGLPYFEYAPTVVDWVLVSILSDLEGNLVWQSAGLLHTDGSIEFLKLPPKKDIQAMEYYILLEHRNHMGAMTPAPVQKVGNQLSYDFRLTDSYVGSNISKGQKQMAPGMWALYAGEGSQVDPYSYDINGHDKLIWVWGNGAFQSYNSVDFNLDGDASGADKILWSENNGVFSSVPKY